MPTLPRKSTLESPLWILRLERKPKGLLQDLGHVLRRVFDAEHLGQPLELELEILVGSEAEIKSSGVAGASRPEAGGAAGCDGRGVGCGGSSGDVVP